MSLALRPGTLVRRAASSAWHRHAGVARMACSPSAAGPARAGTTRGHPPHAKDKARLGFFGGRRHRRASRDAAVRGHALPPGLDLREDERTHGLREEEGQERHALPARCTRDLVAGGQEPIGLRADFRRRALVAESVSPRMEACLTVACSAKAQRACGCRADRVREPPRRRVRGVRVATPARRRRRCRPNDPGEVSVVGRRRRDLVANHPRVVAVGECGLDYVQPAGYVIDGSGRADSLMRRRDGGEIAKSRRLSASESEPLEKNAASPPPRVRRSDGARVSVLGAPIVVHTREAEEDTLRLMREHLPRDHRIHVHCFTSSARLALGAAGVSARGTCALVSQAW